jgi:hypothetical protein
MKKENNIKLFEGNKVRTHWDAEKEKWYISVVDVISVLTDSPNPRKYWSVLKTRLKQEGSELATNCSQLKMQSADGKFYKTDVLDTEQLFRLVQSVPSPKAEPFKLWLAQLGRERLEEMDDPEAGIQRLMNYYIRKGYDEKWISQRLKSIDVRKQLTEEWKERGVIEPQYGILTDIILNEWSGFTTKQYKQHKDLKTESLRDNMTDIELILNMLAEATTTEISKNKQPKTLEQNKKVAKEGGEVASNTRKEIEEKTGKKVISNKNAKTFNIKKMKK